MANVINLGKISRRESPLSGLSDALISGMEAGEEVRSNRADEAIDRSRLDLDEKFLKERELERKSREKMKEASLSSELASQELRKREQDFKNVKATHERFSMWWNNMDAQEKAIAKTSEQYKEMQKFFKSFSDLVPGLVADDGSIVAQDSKTIFKTKLENAVAGAKLALASGKATEKDLMLLQVGEKDLDMLSEAFKSASQRVKGDTDTRGLVQKIGDAFAAFRRGNKAPAEAVTPVQQGLAVRQPQVTQPQAPVNKNTEALGGSTYDPSDPLGILRR